MSKKTVIFEIEVPTGDFCWNQKNGTICKHFDNSETMHSCSLFHINHVPFDDRDKYQFPKPLACLNLKEVKE